MYNDQFRFLDYNLIHILKTNTLDFMNEQQ